MGDSPRRVCVRAPSGIGGRWGALGVGGALLVSALVGCSDYSYTSQTNKDIFQQRRRNTVDVLMVVDNSCSMAEEQNKLASNFDGFIEAFSGVDVDWQIAVTTTDTLDPAQSGHLLGGDDEVVLKSAEGRTLDRVAWKATWGMTAGVSLQLDRELRSPTDNDSPESWCPSTASFGDGDLGSPGAANESCGAPVEEAPPVADDLGPREPNANDILFTEIMADPSSVADVAGEWVELLNVSTDTLDLSGCVLGDEGRNSFEVPAGTTVAPGATVVFGRSADLGVNGGVVVQVETQTAMTLNNDIKVLTPDTEGADEIFGELVAVGVTGSGIESGLDASRLALSEPLLSGDNAGFVREEANISLIYVSDENDYSRDGVSDYLTFFRDLKGEDAWRDPSFVTISAVAGIEAPAYEGQPSCESSNGFAAYGIRYVDLAARTDGAIESICNEDFSPIAAELGLTVSGLDVEFLLSEQPVISSLVVKLYETDAESSLMGELVIDVDYSYDDVKNAVVFAPQQVPPSQAYIVAEYKVAAEGVTQESDQ